MKFLEKEILSLKFHGNLAHPFKMTQTLVLITSMSWYMLKLDAKKIDVLKSLMQTYGINEIVLFVVRFH